MSLVSASRSQAPYVTVDTLLSTAKAIIDHFEGRLEALTASSLSSTVGTKEKLSQRVNGQNSGSVSLLEKIKLIVI